MLGGGGLVCFLVVWFEMKFVRVKVFGRDL